MATELSFISGRQISNDSGVVQSGAKLYFYRAGTTTALTVWQDSAATVAHAQPVVCDAGGFVPLIYVDDTYDYKIVITSSSDVTLRTYDNLPKAVDPTSGSSDSAKLLLEWSTITASTKTVITSELGTGFLANTTSNDITFTLPSAITSGNGKSLYFKKTSGANVVTINAITGQVIDNRNSFKMFARDGFLQLVSNGSNWVVVENNKLGRPGQLIPTAEVIAPTGTVFTYGQTLSRTIYDEVFDNITLQVTANTTNAGNQLTSISGLTEAIGAGCLIEGNGIPAGTTVSSVSGSTITMSANATATQTGIDVRLLPWGRGDGATTFNTPNTRSRALLGRSNMGGTSNGLITTGFAGFDGNSLGQSGGNQAVQEHGHGIRESSGNISVQSGGGTLVSGPNSATSSDTFGIGDAQNVQPSVITNYLMVL
ncbi:MAG: hypothetical protein AAF228_12120 [Pseudomonadota bacterium]